MSDPYEVIRRTPLRPIGERAPDDPLSAFLRGVYWGIATERVRQMKSYTHLDNVKNISAEANYELVELRFAEPSNNVRITLTQEQLTDLLHQLAHVVNALEMKDE